MEVHSENFTRSYPGRSTQEFPLGIPPGVSFGDCSETSRDTCRCNSKNYFWEFFQKFFLKISQKVPSRKSSRNSLCSSLHQFFLKVSQEFYREVSSGIPYGVFTRSSFTRFLQQFPPLWRFVEESPLEIVPISHWLMHQRFPLNILPEI